MWYLSNMFNLSIIRQWFQWKKNQAINGYQDVPYVFTLVLKLSKHGRINVKEVTVFIYLEISSFTHFDRGFFSDNHSKNFINKAALLEINLVRKNSKA